MSCYFQLHPSKESDVLAQCVFDEKRDQYLLLKVGRVGKRRIRGTMLYIRLRNGKFWIEEDMTKEGIATDLLKDIVVGYWSPTWPLAECTQDNHHQVGIFGCQIIESLHIALFLWGQSILSPMTRANRFL
jgi:hypothetical protein